MTAKEEILQRIKGAKVPPSPAERPAFAGSMRPRAEVVAQFLEYAEEYKARVRTVGLEGLPAAISEWIGAERVIAPPDLPPAWTPAGMNLTHDQGFRAEELESFNAVITGCAIAISETGTVVLDAGFAQGRRALTLIPDHHLCVVFEEQIVDSVPEAMLQLRIAANEGRPLTWISGPSATSDIELSRVEGVHGPRNLDIVVVRG